MENTLLISGDYFIIFFQLERKRADEKSERDRLNDVYLELVEKQRAYYKRVKEFQDVSKSYNVMTLYFMDGG